MTCCNNSEQIRFENLLKEGCEYKTEKKKINIRHSNKHFKNIWNSARFCFQKILAPDYQMCGQILTLPEKKDSIHNMVTTFNRISCMSMYWETTTYQSNQTEKKKNIIHAGSSQSHAQGSLFLLRYFKDSSS